MVGWLVVVVWLSWVYVSDLDGGGCVGADALVPHGHAEPGGGLGELAARVKLFARTHARTHRHMHMHTLSPSKVSQ